VSVMTIPHSVSITWARLWSSCELTLKRGHEFIKIPIRVLSKQTRVLTGNWHLVPISCPHRNAIGERPQARDICWPSPTKQVGIVLTEQK